MFSSQRSGSQHEKPFPSPSATGPAVTHDPRTATLILMVGLPGAGKATRAWELAAAHQALRLTPDHWMIPLFGDSMADGKRSVLEGRLISVALQALRLGTSVVLDYGLSDRDERSALRWLARSAGSMPADLPARGQRRPARRIAHRQETRPHQTFPMSDPGRVGHNSYVRIGSASLFYFGSSYDQDIAALFTEADRYFEAGEEGEYDSYGYQTTARRIRERLQARGFSARRAWSGLASAVEKWAKEPGDGRRPGSVEEEFQRFALQLEDVPVVGFQEFLDDVEEFNKFEAATDQPSAFLWHLDTRDVLRLLLDQVPDDTVIALDLSELTGCCVEMDPQRPVAESARHEQLQHVALDSPLIVLTEGSTDSRLLSAGMKITHPHLVGFINFIDFDSFNAEGGVAMLPKIVYAFAASGVANRIAAIGDNDTEAHDALEKIKNDPSLPENVRILHYPDLPTLKNYPTLGPYSPDPVLRDINGSAAALEMYLGRDALTIDGQLVPVQWRNYNAKLGRYQGTLLDKDKKAVQKAFAEKVKQALARGGTTAEEDWSGIEAIIEGLLTAFD